MIGPSIQNAAQTAIELLANSLPAGLLIVLLVGGLLRAMRRQNSGTRFAVWFVALLTVATLPFLGNVGGKSLYVFGTAVPAAFESIRPAFMVSDRWATVLFAIWAVGAGIGMVRVALGLCRLQQIRRECVPVCAEQLDPVLQATMKTIQASGSLTVATSDRVRVPSAIGLWRRTIILPSWVLLEMAPNDLNVILLHEFAHLRRWDDWTNLIQKIVCALLFFHPAVWWIDSRLAVEREMACDDAVLAETSNPQGYASCLVSLLEKSLAHRGWSMAQAAVHRAHEAAQRLAQILDTNRPVATRVWRPAIGIVSVFSITCLMAVPLGPKFIAFDGPAQANENHIAYSVASANELPASMKAPVVVPAAWQTSEPASVTNAVPTRVRSAADASISKIRGSRAAARKKILTVPSDRVIPAQFETTPAPPPVVLLGAAADADPASRAPVRTLVFVQTMQFLTPDGPVWSVQVWHVWLVNAGRAQTMRAAVSNSI